MARKWNEHGDLKPRSLSRSGSSALFPLFPLSPLFRLSRQDFFRQDFFRLDLVRLNLFRLNLFRLDLARRDLFRLNLVRLDFFRPSLALTFCPSRVAMPPMLLALSYC